MYSKAMTTKGMMAGMFVFMLLMMFAVLTAPAQARGLADQAFGLGNQAPIHDFTDDMANLLHGADDAAEEPALGIEDLVVPGLPVLELPHPILPEIPSDDQDGVEVEPDEPATDGGGDETVQPDDPATDDGGGETVQPDDPATDGGGGEPAQPDEPATDDGDDEPAQPADENEPDQPATTDTTQPDPGQPLEQTTLAYTGGDNTPYLIAGAVIALFGALVLLRKRSDADRS